MKYVIIAAVAVSVSSAVAAPSRAQSATPRERLNGEWTGTLVLDNSSPRITLVFQLTDSTFAGKTLADGSPFGDMEGGSLNGNKFHFKVDRLEFSGTVSVPTMKIDMVMYNGSTRVLTVTKTPDVRPNAAPPPRPPTQTDSAIAFSSSVISTGTSAKRPVLR